MTPQLRKWQKEALDIWLENQSGIVEVVTGGGKTIFAFFCIKELLKKYAGLETIIIVPTLTLADQWAVSLSEDAGFDKKDIKVFSGYEKHDQLAMLNVFVINTARNIIPTLTSIAPKFLIVDECHRSGSSKNAAVLDGDWTATLGLSATPERQHDEALSEVLIPKLGKIIFRYSYKEAYEDGVICDFNLINIEGKLTPPEQEEYDKLTKRCAILLKQLENGDTSVEEQLKYLYLKRSRLSNKASIRVPLAVKIAMENRTKNVLIFHEDIRSSDKIVELLGHYSIEAVSYHTKVGPNIRRSNLQLYKKGITKVLASCHALDEGFNVPETEIGIIASSTSSSRQRIQRLGRMLRPSKDKNHAAIYTIYCTSQEKSRLQVEEKELGKTANVVWQKVLV